MQLLASFKLFSQYSSVDMSDASCENSYHKWTQQQVEQGFSWYPRSVAFGLLIDCGEVRVEVWRADDVSITPQAKRAIVVPFTVGPAAQVVISDLVNGQAVSVPEGFYALVYEIGYNDEDVVYHDVGQVMAINMWCRFSFIPAESLQAKVLRADPELSHTYPLVMRTLLLKRCKPTKSPQSAR